MSFLPPLPSSAAVTVTLPRQVASREEALDVLRNFSLSERPVTLSFRACLSISQEAIDTLVEAILVDRAAQSLTAHAATPPRAAALQAAAARLGVASRLHVLRPHTF